MGEPGTLWEWESSDGGSGGEMVMLRLWLLLLGPEEPAGGRLSGFTSFGGSIAFGEALSEDNIVARGRVCQSRLRLPRLTWGMARSMTVAMRRWERGESVNTSWSWLFFLFLFLNLNFPMRS